MNYFLLRYYKEDLFIMDAGIYKRITRMSIFNKAKNCERFLNNLPLRIIGKKPKSCYISCCRSLSSKQKEGQLIAGDNVEILV